MAISKNVKMAMDALQADPALLKELNTVLAKVNAKAKVRLTDTEKAAFFSELRKKIVEKNAAVVAWI
jgi:hypothetical protein